MAEAVTVNDFEIFIFWKIDFVRQLATIFQNMFLPVSSLLVMITFYGYGIRKEGMDKSILKII